MKIGQVYIKNGRKWVHRRYGDAIYWTADMLYDLRDMFPHTSDKEVAEYFGLGEMTIRRKAKALGLKKSQEWIKRRNKIMVAMSVIMRAKNGNPGCFKKGCKPLNSFMPGTSYRKKKIIRLDTMQVYDSGKDFANEIGVKRCAVYSALARNGKCAGIKVMWLKTYNNIYKKNTE